MEHHLSRIDQVRYSRAVANLIESLMLRSFRGLETVSPPQTVHLITISICSCRVAIEILFGLLDSAHQMRFAHVRRLDTVLPG